MADPFLGQIIMFGGNFAPRGWAFCDGQLLAISGNSALFSILGTTYGGDGRTSFALPDLRGRVAVHAGNSTGPGLSNRRLGARGGSETNTLNVTNLPSHSHAVSIKGASSKEGELTSPVGTQLAVSDDRNYVNDPGTNINATGNAGGSQAVNNMQPYTAVNYIIALQGVFPSRS
jgi:microcystin-dependent protein